MSDGRGGRDRFRVGPRRDASGGDEASAWGWGLERLRRRLVVPPVVDERLPTRLCRHLVELLPVSGAGICVMFAPDVSVPVGVSDAAVMEAEAWQFSRAQGPCWQVYASDRVVVSGDLTDPTGPAARAWPALCAPIIAHTDFRHVVSAPLHVERAAAASLNLYSATAPAVPGVVVDAVHRVAAAVGEHLAGRAVSGPVRSAVDPAEEAQGPAARVGGRPARAPAALGVSLAWLDSPISAGRHHVWLAQGMLMHVADISAPPALALLRSYAFAHDRTVDAVADDLVRHQLLAEDVLSS